MSGGRRAGRAVLAALAAWLACAPALRAQAPEPRLATLAAGPTAGIYYVAGGAICHALNRGRWQHGLRCVVRETGGSVENLRALRIGSVDFAIAQSDWVHHAMNGTAVFEGLGPDRGLRAILSLYPEPFTVVARQGAGISSLADLAGKRVNFGPYGSGGRATMEVVMGRIGWTAADFSHVSDLAYAELPSAICSGDIDAAILVIAHPSRAVEDILSACETVLVPVDGDLVARVTADNPDYFAYDIPARTYPGQPARVPGFALAALLVTRSQTSPSVVRALTGAVVGALEGFRALHPAFSEFDLERMRQEGMSAPLHEGARRFWATADAAADRAAGEGAP